MPKIGDVTTLSDEVLLREINKAQKACLPVHFQSDEDWLKTLEKEHRRRKAEKHAKWARGVMDEMALAPALWWFIENFNEDDPGRSDVFFYLRERVRNAETEDEPAGT